MSRILYFDCFSGVSGDMMLGALLDAGLPLDALRAALGSLPTGDRAFTIAADRVSRAGVAATKFRLVEVGHAQLPETPGSGHVSVHRCHGEAHRHHHYNALAEVVALIDRSALSAPGKARAKALFERLAEAEAAIHQTSVDQIHLHEVGALDSIIDVVGAVFGLEWFGASEVVSSPLNVGSGTVECAHGTLPVPAPATARLLMGVPVYAQGPPGELVTPTGALLVTGHASSYGPMPLMRPERVGYGAGDRDVAGAPNVFRLFVGDRAAAPAGDRVGVLEFEIDDMNPQIFGMLMDRLYAAGAHEVFYVAAQMKKNRPGTLVTVVAPPARREGLSAVIFGETTTIGLRYQEVERECLARETVTLETPLGTVRVKVARRGGVVVNVAPEFEDCARVSAVCGVSVKEVQALAMKTYLDRRA
jgi:uncharacterized protein (TIGR00299 family) protein